MSDKYYDEDGNLINNCPASIFYGTQESTTPDIMRRYFDLYESVSSTGLIVTKEIDDSMLAQATAEVGIQRV